MANLNNLVYVVCKNKTGATVSVPNSGQSSRRELPQPSFTAPMTGPSTGGGTTTETKAVF